MKFSNYQERKSRIVMGSAGILPAVSGILPDTTHDKVTLFVCAESKDRRQHVGRSGQNARAPQTLPGITS